MKGFFLNRDGIPFIILPMEEATRYDEIKHITEGGTVAAGENVLILVAMDEEAR